MKGLRDIVRTWDCSLDATASLSGGRALKKGRHGGCLQLEKGRLETLELPMVYRLSNSWPRNQPGSDTVPEDMTKM